MVKNHAAADDMPEPLGPTYPAETPAVNLSGLAYQTNSGANFACVEEGALLHAFRLLHRCGPQAVLTPVERAFIAGARMTFQMLSEQCQQLLERTEELSLVDAAEPPKSTGQTAKRTSPRRRRTGRTSS